MPKTSVCQSFATSTSIEIPSLSAMKSSKPEQLQRYEQKSRKICERLRSCIPQYDQMISTLKSRGSWWCHFHRKIQPSARFKESLVAYAAQLYTSTSPIDLGILATAYARSTGQDQHLYSLVEQLVLSDTTYSHTLQGLECILLLAKSYTDIGQPRRSWCISRQGVNIAQLIVFDT